MPPSSDTSTPRRGGHASPPAREAYLELAIVIGEKAKGFYVVASGSVRAFRAGADGREQIIHVERAGATVGELPVFDDQPYPSTVAAEEDSVVDFLDRQTVRTCATGIQRSP